MKKIVKIVIALMIVLTIISSFSICYADSISDTFNQADDFLNNGKKEANKDSEKNIDTELKNSADVIYNVLLAAGVVIAVIIGGILGIKFMIASIEDKAKIKEALIPYIIGCIVVFGSFGIWKLVVTLLNQIS